MKRFLKGLLFALVAVFGVTLASCEQTKTPTPTEPAHTHTLADGWKRDSATHWHECSGCDELVDLDVHNYGDWTKDAKECKQTRDCTVCGFRETRAVDHSWNAEGTCTHCGESLTITQYYVRGSMTGSDWPALEEYKLAIDYDTRSASITVSLNAGDEFKVADANWSAEFNAKTITCEEGLFDGDNNIIVKTTAEYEIVLTKLETSEPVCTITQKCVHEFGEWTLVEGKTCEKQATCTKCQVVSTKIEHKGYSEFALVEGKTCDWESVCACGDKKTEVRHTWGEDIVCDDCGAVNVIQFYVRGEMNSWDTSAALELSKDSKSATALLVVEAGQCFKIASSDWNNEFNFDTITFNVKGFERKTADSNDVKASKDGVYVVTVSGLDTLTPTCTIDAVQLYVKGGMNGWATNADYALVYDKETDTATLKLEYSDVTAEFKVAPDNWDLYDKHYNMGVVGDAYGYGTLENDAKNIKLAEVGFYLVKVANVTTGEPVLTIAKTEGTVEPVVIPVQDMYVVGSHNGWGDAFVDANKLAVDTTADTATLEVLLVAGTEFKVSDSNWGCQFGFGATGLTFAEGLFTDKGGNLLVAETGVYKVVVSGLADKSKATCTITKVVGVSTIAEVKALEDNTVVLVAGSVKSVYLGGTSVITDGTNELNVYKLSTTAHLCLDDEVLLYGKKSSHNETAQLAQGATIVSNTKADRAISAGLSAITSVEQLTDGMNIVIGYEKNLMGLSSSNGEYRTSTLVNSLNVVDDPCIQVVKLVKSGDNWILQVAEGTNLYATNANKLWTGDKTDESAQWTITITEGVATITNVSFTNRIIRFNTNSGQERFATYEASFTNGKDVTLYSLFSAALYTPTASETQGELTKAVVWNEIFTLGVADSTTYKKGWKVSSNKKTIYDLNGEIVEITHRLQSQGKNIMTIDLSEYKGYVKVYFYALTGDNGELTRSFTILDGEEELETFTCNVSSEDLPSDTNPLKVQEFSIVLECGKTYTLTTSAAINFHAIKVVPTEAPAAE